MLSSKFSSQRVESTSLHVTVIVDQPAKNGGVALLGPVLMLMRESSVVAFCTAEDDLVRRPDAGERAHGSW